MLGLGFGGSNSIIMEPPPYPPPLDDPRLTKPLPLLTTSDEAVVESAVVAMPPVVTTTVTTTSTTDSSGDEAAGVIGVLEVLIHQARDIHNICIYHKQDVYAKLCLTTSSSSSSSSSSSDDDSSHLTTRIINGGGRNPVFNDTLRLHVRTLDDSSSSLKCEIWMLSRARNYLEDQLLGFALVPLSDVLLATNATLLAQDFSLSSTDLFHSPAGFVQLSLSYRASSSSSSSLDLMLPIHDTALPDACCCTDEPPVMLDKIEFPDLKVVNENQMMLSEYFGIPCSTLLESQSPQSFITSHNGATLSLSLNEEDDHDDDAAGVRVVESFSTGSNGAAIKHENDNTPSLSSASAPAISNSMTCSAETGGASPPSLKDKSTDVSESEVDSSSFSSPGGGGGGAGAGGLSAPSVSDNKGFLLHTPIIKIDIEPEEETVKRQEIVDMYMKSMQQFTESLAKMKLPMDIENNAQIAENQNSSENNNNESQVSKGTTTGSRVFYGSRAFF